MDAGAPDDRDDLAVLVSGNLCHLWLCFCTVLSRVLALECRLAVCHQPGCKSGVHANPIWLAKFTIGSLGYRRGLANHLLDDRGHLEPLQVGGDIASSLSALGLHSDGFAVHDYLE